MTASAQTRRNRSVGGRKAALAKAARARREEALYGPDGTHRGSAPIVWDLADVLARLRRAAERRTRPDPGGG